MGNRYFVFWDDNFFGDVDYAVRLMTALKRLRRRWAAQVSIDRCADERLLRLARESGCVYLFIGLESFSEEGLASVNKGFNQVARYPEIIRLIHQHGICVQAGVIFGFDADSKEVFAHTLRACESMGIDGVTVSVLTPLPGTRLYDEMKQDWPAGQRRLGRLQRQDAGGVPAEANDPGRAVRRIHVVPPAILLLPVHVPADGGVANESRSQPPCESGVQMVTVGTSKHPKPCHVRIN